MDGIQEYAEIVAIRRLVVWLAAREVGRAGNSNAFLSSMLDDLQALPDAESARDGQPFSGFLAVITASIDGIVQEVAKEVERGGRSNTSP